MHVLPTGTFDSACYLYKKAEKYYDPIYQLFINIYGLGAALNTALPLPKAVEMGYNALGYIGIVDALFVGPRIYRNITNIIQDIKPLENGILAVCELSGTIWVAVDIVQLVKSFGFLTKSLSWTNSLSAAFLPSKVVTFGQNVQSALALYNINQKLTPQFIQDHPQELRSYLTLSKKYSLENISFVHARIRLHLAFAISDSIASGAATLLSITSFTFSNTYLTAAVYATTAISQIALVILRSKFLPKKPTTLV